MCLESAPEREIIPVNKTWKESALGIKQYKKYYRMRDTDIKLYKQVDENLTFFKLRCASTGSL